VQLTASIRPETASSSLRVSDHRAADADDLRRLVRSLAILFPHFWGNRIDRLPDLSLLRLCLIERQEVPPPRMPLDFSGLGWVHN